MSELRAVFERQGAALPVAGNAPLVLDARDSVWLVRAGALDVFAIVDGREAGRSHLVHVEPGGVLFGLAHLEGVRLEAKGPAGTEVLRLGLRALVEQGGVADSQAAFEAWRALLGAALPDLQAQPSAGAASLQALARARDELGADVARALRAREEEARAADAEQIRRRVDADAVALDGALRALASVLAERPGAPVADAGASPLFAAVRLVAEHEGVPVEAPPDLLRAELEGEAPLERIARASRFRIRRVALRGDWWRGDAGALIGFLAADHRPVAILPIAPGVHAVVDPTTGDRAPALGAELEPFAYAICKSFPDVRLTIGAVLAFGARAVKRDLAVVALVGLASALLGMLIPLATARIFDVVIPGADRDHLLEIVIALLVAGLAGTAFTFVRAVALQRVEGRIGNTIQQAVWSRLIALPPRFFRQYTAGDLAERANGIARIQQIFSGTAANAILTSIFSLSNLYAMATFDGGLTALAALLVVLFFAVTVASGAYRLRIERPVSDREGRILGLLVQLISGIAKLRTVGAESRAFARWAALFAEQRRLVFRARSVVSATAVFAAAYPLLATALLFHFTIASGLGGPRLSTGAFIGFNAAFGILLGSAVVIAEEMTEVLRTVPLYERARPILEGVPEVDRPKKHPGILRGLELSHVSFRYRPDGPLVLEDVSLEVRAGEFVAIVGASGSGKSTLLRLMLGFEKPSTGSVYYDGQELEGLDVHVVRRQLGVVLQHSEIMQGDILSNIVGTSLLGLDAAWEAAELAALADDIRALPMGMHTVLPHGGGTLSGGQRQRLRIARAVATRPQILFFDEATSALDNQTQAAVSHGLERLSAARVVIAHRLSTVRKAHRIYVLARGRLVSTGTFAELLERCPVFQELARRQMT